MMQPFVSLKALAAPYFQANVDTDKLIPHRFLRKPLSAGYRNFLFYNERFTPEGAARGEMVLVIDRDVIDEGVAEGTQTTSSVADLVAAFEAEGLDQRAALKRAARVGPGRAVLEVRAGNEAAQALYRHFGFEVTGRRRNYYREPTEDALVMTLTL